MRPDREMQAHLGDIPDYLNEEPIRLPYRTEYNGPRWIETMTGALIGWLAFLTFVALIVAWLVMLFLYAAARPAHAHGDAEWIQQGNYKNSAGELCCGERDCRELADTEVKVTAEGYHVRVVNRFENRSIVSIDETVPFAEAAPSPDGKYWRCQWGGMRKCFFAPPPAT